MIKWSANTRRALQLGLIEAIEARRAREKELTSQPSTLERMLEFVRDNPGCTYQDIAKGLQLTVLQLYGARIHRDQRVVRSSTQFARWWAENQNTPVVLSADGVQILESADTLIAAAMAR